jgi:Ca2+-transporting ATPase
MAYYDEPVKQVLLDLATKEEGLSSLQAKQRLDDYGRNEIVQKQPLHWTWILLRQFNSPITWVLMAALIIALFVGENIDSFVILVIILLDALIGFLQEWKAENAITALKHTLGLKATVLRDGEQEVIDAAEVVPGDIVLVERGMKVPADGRVIWESALQTLESAFSGESTPIRKSIGQLATGKQVAERKNMVFAGTTVTSGRGRIVVTATGMKTQLGAIATMLEETPEDQTPLQKKLGKLSVSITCIVVAMSIIFFGVGALKGQPLMQIFFAAVALAVAAIPEGLPAVVTLSLAFGVQRMLRRNALVRHLPSVETLGSCTVICTDKTGTLTQDKMTVREIYVPHKTIAVDDIAGKNGLKCEPKQHEMIIHIGALCNNASLSHEGETQTTLGDPTEGALLMLARKHCATASTEPRLAEIQFTSERKRMTTIHQKGAKRIAYTKGAPDVILGLCCKKIVGGKVSQLTAADRERILRANEDMARRAMRVLAFAYRELSTSEAADEAVEKNLIFAGLQGMIDPPRKEAAQAIKTAQEAGIRVVMITGDHPLTATAIAKELGIPGKTMTGIQLENEPDLASVIDSVGVFARVDPAHKLRIVEALKKKGHIVAMTGDGVNDAPALKKADIGIAMGKGGTDVAREASDMVLADDNFATIVEAVRGGRTIMDNIIKFVSYIVGHNMGEVLTVFVAILVGFPLPITALMLLWINLLTDGPPAIALGLEKAEPGVMLRGPRKVDEGIITPMRLARMLVVAACMMVGALALFSWQLPNGLQKAQSIAFAALGLFQIAIVFGYRSERVLFHKLGLFSNKWLIGTVALSISLLVSAIHWPPLQVMFGTVALGAVEWSLVVVVSMALLIVSQIIIATAPTPE